MTECPCDKPPQRILRIPAGLSALPRQTQAFPEVRIALLEEVARNPALDGWRARGERDFGVMWLEMWAYVADLLGFYDERIANESYLRTAVRRPSLRRIIDLLGYVPAPGVAGSAFIAAIAEGRTLVSVPGSTAFRSDAFGDEEPQVFETEGAGSVHPFNNSWQLGAVPPPNLLSQAPPVPPDAPHAPLEFRSTELVFETAELGLAKDRLALITHTDSNSQLFGFPQVARVQKVTPFEGKDGRTYIRASFDRGVDVATTDDVATILVQTPTVTARITSNVPPRVPPPPPHPPAPQLPPRFPVIDNVPTGEGDEQTRVFLDAIYRQLRQGEPIIAERKAQNIQGISQVRATVEELVSLEPKFSIADEIRLPVTKADLFPALDEDLFLGTVSPDEITFHFAFVDAGRLTAVAETELTEGLLRASAGAPVIGIAERPPGITGPLVLSQKFLLRDVDNQGAHVKGALTINADGTAAFRVTEDGLPPVLKAPITVFGNVLKVARGESVFEEILGSGDARTARQTFKLKKKPLTYFFDPSVESTKARSTLEVLVDDVRWREVRSFFGRGPQDQVYIVRHDDEGNTLLTFGDGVRGARLPSGIQNVRANYRFGSGEAAPPAGAIKQLAKAVKGLRRVESPIAAVGGKDPDPPELLRTSAPQSVLIFGRAVSTLDFEALANLVPGVVTATAEFLWIEEEQEAGVVVTYIGTALEKDVLEALRKEAEPGLPLVAQPAIAKPRTFRLDVEVDPRFDKDVVARAVKAALIDPVTGPLAKRNAPIGQRLLRSVIFDAIHDVAGVAGIIAASLQDLDGVTTTDFRVTGFSSGGGFNSPFPGPCPGAGQFYDFADGERVEVNGILATAPVLGTEAER